jgi:hypothetical protein
MVLHGMWDANVGIGNGNGLLIAVLMIAEILAGFAAVIWVFHRTVRPERDAMRAVMTPEADDGVITGEELNALAGGWKQRRAYRKAAHGPTDRRARHHRLEAAHDLADPLAGTARGAVVSWALLHEVAERRRRLLAGVPLQCRHGWCPVGDPTWHGSGLVRFAGPAQCGLGGCPRKPHPGDR